MFYQAHLKSGKLNNRKYIVFSKNTEKLKKLKKIKWKKVNTGM